MAFVLTYQTLTDTLIAYLERQDARLIENIPVFIMLGQRRVTRDLKILNIKKFVTGSLVTDSYVTASGSVLLAKPGDWLQTAYFNIGVTNTDGSISQVQLQMRLNEYLDSYWPIATNTGQPKYIADYEFQTFKIVPTPDNDYPYTLGYYALPPLLDDTNGVNILTSTIPEALEYACLLETATFVKDDERVPVWTDYYNKAAQAITKEDLERIQVGYTNYNH